MLNKQLVPIQFGALDEKTEAKALAPGGMITVKNAERNKTGRYDKRTGYGTAFSTTVARAAGTYTASNIKSIASSGKSVFALDANTGGDFRVIGYSADGSFYEKGDFYPVSVQTTKLSANYSEDALMIASASNATYTCVAWTTSTFAYMQILDNSTKEVLAYTTTAITANGGPCIQAVELSDVFYVFVNSDANDINMFFWDPSTPNSCGTTFSSISIVTDMSSSSKNFIVRTGIANSKMYLIYSDTGNLIQVSTSTGGSLTSLNNTQTGYNPVGLVLDDSDNIYAFFEDAGGSSDYAIYNSSGTVLVAAANFEASGGLVVGYSTGASSIAAWSNSTVSPGTCDVLLKVENLTTSGIGGGSATTMYQTQIISDVWKRNGKYYFVVLAKSQTQPTYFVVEHEAYSASGYNIVAKIAQKSGISANSAVSDTTEYALPVPSNVGVQSSDIFNIPILRATGINTDGATAINKPGAAIVALEYKTINQLPHVSVGDSAFIAGGFLALYDGEGIYENGFHLYPEVDSLTSANSTGSLTNSGVYSYKFVYEWNDAKGRLHRSEPSVATSITLGGSDDTVTINMPPLSFTGKDFVRVVAYRTTNGGSTYYRTISEDRASSVTSVTFTDGLSDANLTDNEILYTDGGEYSNEQPPACGHLAVFKNRLWATDLEDGSLAWYSKLRITNDDTYSFNENLVLSVGDAARVKASQAIDDKLIFFKTDKILYTYGDGPDNTGNNGSFAEASDVNIDGGISEAASLVQFPRGLIWKHQRGFYAMGGDLAPQYIGKAVEDFNSLTVTSAVLIPSKNQIRWTHSAGSILAYDYFHQQWYEYSSLQCSGATIKDGKHVVVSSNNVYEQDDTVWTDGGSSYNFVVETGWISLAGLSGYKRVYRLFFEAAYKADHDLTVTVYTEQDGTVYTDTYTVDAATVSGGTDTYRWDIQLKRQKCSSIKIKIQDTNLAGTEQSLNLINMAMLVGVKVGGPKFASAKSIG